MVNTSDSFSSLWNGHESVPLFDEFSYVVLSAEDLQPAFTNFQQRMWSGYQECNIDLALTAAESAASSKLAARLESAFHLYLGIFAHDRLIGWSWGRQESAEEFHMIITALLPEWRRRGIYSALLPHVLARTETEGFQSVYSWHYPDSAAVLIPKLKAGFVIGGMRLWDQHGLLVQLVYPFNRVRRQLFSYRSGHAPKSDAIELLLG